MAAEAVARLDLRAHRGAHPRLGVVDVVPFVPLEGSTMDDAIVARDRFLDVGGGGAGPARLRLRARAVAARGSPVGLHGRWRPTAGPPAPHPTRRRGVRRAPGRCWWPTTCGWPAASGWTRPAGWRPRCAGRASCGPSGSTSGGRAQVSMNLVDPLAVGPATAFDAVRALVAVDGAELVGLLPAAVLDAVPSERWEELDLSRSRTIEAAGCRRESER